MEFVFWAVAIWFALSFVTAPLIGALGRANDIPTSAEPGPGLDGNGTQPGSRTVDTKSFVTGAAERGVAICDAGAESQGGSRSLQFVRATTIDARTVIGRVSTNAM